MVGGRCRGQFIILPHLQTASAFAGSFFTAKCLMRPPSIAPPSAQQTAATMPSLRVDSPRSNPSDTKIKVVSQQHHAADLTALSMDFHLQCLYEHRFPAHRTRPRRTRHRSLFAQSARGLRVGARPSNHWAGLYPSRRASTRRSHGDTRCASTQPRHHGHNCVRHA